MNSPHHPHHEHQDVHQQRLLWFFSFCNQRSSSSSSSSGGSNSGSRARTSLGRTRKTASSRNKFALQYQQQLQQQQRQSSIVFGRDLTEHTQLFSDDDSIPHIVKSCTRFIEKHGIIFGIYRLSGMRVNIHKLRQDFDKNPKISMIDAETISNDAHAVACVLKQYFRELPIPLLTFHMYEKFIQLFKHSNTINPIKESNTVDTNDNNNDNSNTVWTVDGQGEHDDTDQHHPKQQLQKSPAQRHTLHDNDNEVNDIIEKQSTGPSESAIATNTTSAISTATISFSPDTDTVSADKTTRSELSEAQSTTAISTRDKPQSKQFTEVVSDSQLISLSSVVTTTTSDIKYQVKLGDLRELLLQLPRAHYQTLKFLMRHLSCIAANGEKTGMDSKNVAIVWAPNLLKPRELELSAGLETLQIIGLQAVITEQLIKHHKFLFDDEEW